LGENQLRRSGKEDEMAQQGTINAALAGSIQLGGDFTVNRLGFGAMRLTGKGIWGEPTDTEEAKRVLRRAIELGINFIDTADSYGPEVSERLIGEALYPYPDDLVIATKAGLTRPGPGQWEPNGRPEYLRKQVEGSLRRLRVDELDILQFHRPDPKVPLEESVGALVELKNEGKIRHIGLSNINIDELKRAEKLTPIVSVQNRYNVFDRESEPVLEQCSLEELAFLPWRPVGGGEMTEAAGTLQKVANRYKATPTQVAIAWLLAHSPVMLPIAGTSKVAHLEENVGAAALDIAPSDLADLDKLGE
jgi:aryl-alcohol dehydrogenase-like predicted oxidoreductase